MNFLVDANLAPRLAVLLSRASHESSHVADVLGPGASDPAVMQWALNHDQVVVSADTDFGELHARSGSSLPSVLLFRLPSGRRAKDQARLILENLSSFEDDLREGAMVVIEPGRVRVRKLPM